MASYDDTLAQFGVNVAPADTQDSAPSDNSWSNFEQTATPIAAASDYPLSVLLGQAALESARGTSNFAQSRNNYFGMDAYDSNPDAAKGYATPQASIEDYINLIKNDPRYTQAWHDRSNPKQMIQDIKDAGYATDPNYVSSVESTPEFQSNLNSTPWDTTLAEYGISSQ